MEDWSGWKRIEGDFGKFWVIMEIPPPQCPSFPFIPLIPKQAPKRNSSPSSNPDSLHCRSPKAPPTREALGEEIESGMGGFARRMDGWVGRFG
jgi:hypothetical protein